MSESPTVVHQEHAWVDPSSRRRLHYRLWRPATPRALLVLVHGFGEHGGRYASFAQTLAEQGICVAAADLWGHGRSGGAQGDIDEVSRYVEDGVRITHEVFLRESGQPRYLLFGHSFGGLIAILWALRESTRLTRLIVQSPLLEVGFPLPRWKTVLARVLAAYWPTASFSMNLDLGALTHDAAVIEAYRTDPLVHNTMSARTYVSMLRARDEAMRRAATLQVPVLLLCGSADRIISVGAAQRWFDQLRTEKSCVVFPDGYHELHHEPMKDAVQRHILAWILAAGPQHPADTNTA
jgi:alpha-beta hydrolase superfamily lysophospholipase